METKTPSLVEKIVAQVRQLQDIRAVGLLIFLVVVLLISWSGVKVIETNYRLQKDISRLEQQVAVQKLVNSNLKLENEYYKTNQYLDIAVRQNFGKAAPGETVLIVPERVAQSHTIDLPDIEQQEAQKTESKRPFYQRNFQAWMDFFLHRQSDTN